ncbi:MAG: hypothetical protein OMM_11615, partial [Candidatus Magnetoglobus multicellularis str. Araruama]
MLISWVVYQINYLRITQRVKKTRKNEATLFQSINDLLFGFKELKINKDKSNQFYNNHLLKNISFIKQLRTKAGFAIADSILLPEMTWIVSLFIIVYLSTSFSFLKGGELIKSLQIMIYIPITYILEQLPFFFMANISLK